MATRVWVRTFLWVLCLLQWVVAQEQFLTVSVSPKKQLIAAAGESGVVYVWGSSSDKPIELLTGQAAAVVDLSFSALGDSLAGRCRDGSLKVWDTESWAPVHELEVDSDRAAAVAFSTSGDLFAVDSKSGNIYVFDSKSAEKLLEVKSDAKYVTDLLFLSETVLLSADSSGFISAFDLNSEERLWTRSVSKGWALSLAVDLKGEKVFGFGDDRSVTVLATGDGRELEVFELTDRTSGGTVTKDNHIWALSTAGNLLRLPPGGQEFSAFEPAARNEFLAASPGIGQDELVVANVDNKLHVFSDAGPRVLRFVEEPKLKAAGLATEARTLTSKVEASEKLQEAVQLDPDESLYVLELAECYRQLRRYGEAERLLKTASQRFSGTDLGSLEIELAHIHEWIGYHHWVKRQYQECLACYRESLDLRLRQQPVPASAIDTLHSIKSCLVKLHRPAEAEEALLKAYEIAKEVDDHDTIAEAELNLAEFYRDVYRFPESFRFLELAKERLQDTGNPELLGELSNTAGYNYYLLGDREKELEFQRRSVEANPESFTYVGNLAGTYAQLGLRNECLAQLKKAEELRQRDDRSGLAKLGRYRAILHYRLGDLEVAEAKLQESLVIARGQNEERELRRELFLLTQILLEQQKFTEARPILHEVIRLARGEGVLIGEAQGLGLLARVENGLGNPSLAIFYGKQAIAIYQDLRSKIVGLDQGVQKKFIKSKEETYRRLADLLMAQGRLTEAQQVLRFLKEEEYLEFVRRSDINSAATSQVALSAREREFQEQYDKVRNRVTKTVTEVRILEDRKRAKDEFTSLDQKRLDELRKELVLAKTAFDNFLLRLEKDFAEGKSREGQAQVDRAESQLRGVLRKLDKEGQNAVAVYTLVAKERLHLLVVTSKRPVHRVVDIAESDLNQLIGKFRLEVLDVKSDPRPSAQELYNLLIKPIESDLDGALASDVMWSLDGVLRYLPLAALHDGQSYLAEDAERRHTVVTLASLGELTDPPEDSWTMLAAGVSQAHRVGDKSFSGLPNVPAELEAIVRKEQAEAGLFDGQVWLDDEFTADSLEEALYSGSYQAVHIASHFHFQPGDETGSFLLLGDGSPWYLSDLKSKDWLFQGRDLIAFSACDTATGDIRSAEFDANGREVEPLAVMALKEGTRSVLASLWAVSDESTRLLMQEFYRERKEGVPKGEALRRAQVALLTGKTGGAEKGSDEARFKLTGDKIPANTGAPAFKAEPGKPFAHPYYWAPFVLFGNWL